MNSSSIWSDQMLMLPGPVFPSAAAELPL